MCRSPRLDDLLVRYERETDRYYVIDATTRHFIAGPFARLDVTVGVANSLAFKRNASVWRESIDAHGTVWASPELVTPAPKKGATPQSDPDQRQESEQ
jgi:hypothetical protein